MITFLRERAFEIVAEYSEGAQLPPGTNPFIGKFVIPTIPQVQTNIFFLTDKSHPKKKLNNHQRLPSRLSSTKAQFSKFPKHNLSKL